MQADPSELTDRTRAIFRLVVEAYLENGEPVGSRMLADRGGLNISPASIRSAMQRLEDLGLLAAPHVSAGRMPTEMGLRLFVDGMMQVAEPTDEERRAIESRLVHSRPGEGGPIEDALAATTSALSGLSSCAGLVLAPQRESTLRQLSFVRLSAGQALVVLVAEDGGVENRLIDLPPGFSDAALQEAANFASARLSGLTLGEAGARLERELSDTRATLDRAAADLIRRGLADWSRDAANRQVLIVRGQANLIDASAAADLDRIRQLMDQLESKEEIAALIGRAREGQSTRIFIGSENQLFSLSGSSVIAAPYRDRGGRIVGVVGVIGPTRLNYARIVPIVDFTAQALSRFVT